MTTVGQYIKDFTRHCSNELTPSGYHEWLTPDNALRVAEISKQETIEKACKWIRLHIGVDMPVRLNPDGEPLAEDFFNKAEARCKAADKVVEQFKRAMEDCL